jgi:hypothetical protein
MQYAGNYCGQNGYSIFCIGVLQLCICDVIMDYPMVFSVFCWNRHYTLYRIHWFYRMLLSYRVYRSELEPFITLKCAFVAQLIVFMILVIVQKCVRDIETSFYVFVAELSDNTLIGSIQLYSCSDCPQ